MDLALCHRYGHQPCLPLRFKYPNMSTATRVLTKPHFSFNPSPLSFSNGPILRQARQTFGRHVVYAVDRFSIPSKEDHHKGNDNVIVRGTVGASLIMACVVAIMGCRGIAAPPKSLAMDQFPVEVQKYPFGAQAALISLFEVSVMLARKEDYGKTQLSKFENTQLSKRDADDLKKEAVKLIKAGKSDVAETQLRKVFENVKDKNTSSLNESAYNVQMVLVEILLAQGKYEQASTCECLKLTDGAALIPGESRVYLYKAIISTMVDGPEESKKYWQKFLEDENAWQSGPEDRVIDSGGPAVKKTHRFRKFFGIGN